MRWTRPATARSRSARGGRRLVRAEAGTDRHATARDRVTDGPAEVHPPATRPPLAPHEAAAQARAQRPDELAGLLDVARGELVEGEGEEPAGACGAASARRRVGGAGHFASGAPHVAPSRALGVLRPLRPLVARPRPPVLPGSAPRAGRHRAPARTAPA